MSWWEGGMQGAAGGAALGPLGAGLMGAAGLLAGIFGGGGKPKIPKELRRIYKFQMQMADQQRRFAQSTPLSTPEEQAYLGEQRGQLGEQQQQQREQIYGLYNRSEERR